MTQNIFSTGMQVAQGMQGLRGEDQRQAAFGQQQQNVAEDRQLAADQRAAQEQAAGALGQLKQAYADSGDPAVMRQIIMADPQFAGQIQKQFGVIDDNTKNQAINEAATLKQMLETDPAQAQQYWQQNLAQNPAFAELADNFQAGDIEGALNEVGFGVTAIGGQEAYDSLFGGGGDETAFIQEMKAGGILPGSEEFKSAVLERYGKGDTIGYDVIEGMNPETGLNEYFQVSRVNPNEKIALGIQVPVSASTLKAEAAANDKIEGQKETMTATLGTIQKILGSDGLSGFSGLDSFKRFIPGSEAANVSAWIEQLQSQNFLTAVEQMKGMGALSENEGKKIAGAVAAISPSMSDEAIVSELKKIEGDLITGLDRIESGVLLEVGAQPAASQSQDSGFTANEQPAAKAPIAWSDM